MSLPRRPGAPVSASITGAAPSVAVPLPVERAFVTDVEIGFGISPEPNQQPRSFFYFRELLPYRDMPRDVAAVYTDAVDDPTREKSSLLACLV